MGVFLKEWSPLLAALLVVLSLTSTGITLRTHTESLQGRLTAVEKQVDAIRNAIEGHQGVIVRLAPLDIRMGNQLQSLMTPCDHSIAYDEKEVLNIHHEFQALKNDVSSILNMAQRIGYIEEMLLDMQASIEDIKK